MTSGAMARVVDIDVHWFMIVLEMASLSPPPSPSSMPRRHTGNPATGLTWRLLWRGKDIELIEGAVIVGRSPDCAIIIDSPCVSRNHARFRLAGTVVTVEDLRSSNGVYVNGELVDGVRRLADGDRILLGTEELVVFTTSDAREQAVRSGPELGQSVTETATPERADDVDPTSWRAEAGVEDETHGSDNTTQKADAFESLGRLADRMLAMGRYEAAAKILSNHMRAVLAAARTGAPISGEVLLGASRYALRLAAAKLDGRWIDYAIELHLSVRRPMPVEFVEQLALLFSKGIPADRKQFARYQDLVGHMAENLSGTEQDICQQIARLQPP